MSGKDLFEKMDLISLEYVEEAGEPYQAKKGMWGYYAGLVFWLAAACFFGVICVNRPDSLLSGQPQDNVTEIASVISRTGNLPLVLLIISLVAVVFFGFLIVRKKHGNG